MKIKEIVTYCVNENRNSIDIQFITEEPSEKEYYIEIPEEELEGVCELYQSKVWVDWETDDVLDVKGEINEDALYEGLEHYVNNNLDELQLS
tara:strand:- start:812 stop:1087 length:276 start_codon:yes stop_codon:yes gene_type:complete